MTTSNRRTIIIGSVALAAVAALASPGVGQAHAHGYSTPPGDAVGRPGLINPAPGVRITQAVGDKIFNPNNVKLNESKLGQGYHVAYGTPNYEVPTHGTNGTQRGVLNNAGTLKDTYNAAQSAGRALPKEEDLPGTLVRKISGAPAPTPHQQDPGPANATVPKSNCTARSARNSLRAQGAC